jgi:hypothetical protein
MRQSRSVLTLAIVVSLGFGAACSDANDPVGDTDQLNLDVATYIADMTADDLAMFDLHMEGIMGPMRSPPRRPPRFEDLSMTRDVTFYADDEGSDVYDADATDSLHIVMHMEGSHTRTGERGTLSVDVNRDRDMWLTGLSGAEVEHIWNGTGAEFSHAVHTDDLGEREHAMSSSSQTEDLVIGLPREENPWPLSGTVTRTVSVEGVNHEGEAFSHERTAVITFDGTQFATLSVNGEEFEVDLANREPKRRSR